MKNVFFLAATALLFQSCDRSITAGINAGKTRYVGEESWRDPIGLQVTVESKIVEVNKQSSFNAGIGYSMQGSAWEEGSVSGKVTANYIIGPVIYSYSGKKGFYAEAGLQPAILLSAKDKVNGQAGSYNYKEFMKTFNLGLPVGAGYNFKKGFGLGIRVIPGITKNHKEGNSRDLLILLRASIVLSDGN